MLKTNINKAHIRNLIQVNLSPKFHRYSLKVVSKYLCIYCNYTYRVITL